MTNNIQENEKILESPQRRYLLKGVGAATLLFFYSKIFGCTPNKERGLEKYPIGTVEGTDEISANQIGYWQALMASSNHHYGLEAQQTLNTALSNPQAWANGIWGEFASPDQNFYLRLAQPDDPNKGLPDPSLYLSYLGLRTELSQDALAVVPPNYQAPDLNVFTFYRVVDAKFRNITLSPNAENLHPYLQSLLLIKEVSGTNIEVYIPFLKQVFEELYEQVPEEVDDTTFFLNMVARNEFMKLIWDAMAFHFMLPVAAQLYQNNQLPELKPYFDSMKFNPERSLGDTLSILIDKGALILQNDRYVWNPAISLESREHVKFLMNEFFPVNFDQIFEDMRSAKGIERIKELWHCSSREEIFARLLTPSAPKTLTRRNFLFLLSQT